MWSDAKLQLAALLKKGVYTDLLGNHEYRAFLMRGKLVPPFTQYQSGIPVGLKARYEAVCDFTAFRITEDLKALKALNESGHEHRLEAIEFSGNRRIYRVVDPKARVRGEWWFTEDLLLKLLPECKRSGMDYRLCLLAKLRNRLAICEDWNHVTGIWELKLRSHRLPAICGEGLPQGALSPDALRKGKVSAELYQRYDNQKYAGGELQIWLPWLPNVMISELSSV